MSDEFSLTPDAARKIAALGGLDADFATADRIVRSVGGVTAAAADFRDQIAFDDTVGEFSRISRDGAK